MSNSVSNNNDNTECTICCILIDDVFEHPILKVSICKECLDTLESANRPEEEWCLWCGKGHADMLVCVQCPRQCCITCATRNLGHDYVDLVNEKNWSCFVCDCDPIVDQQREYLRMISHHVIEVTPLTAPGASRATVDIVSPVIVMEDSAEDTSIRKGAGQDLDLILSVYERQIQSSLELDDANIPAIIKEINSLKTEQLDIAIYSYKKCLNAFMSDLTNLEARVTQADSFNNPATLIKLTSLLKILVQHHIFNRICHPQARIKDDHVIWMTDHKPPLTATKKTASVVMAGSGNASTRRHSEMIPRPRATLERKDREVSEMVHKIKDLCSKRRPAQSDPDEDFEPSPYNKRLKVVQESEGRRARSLCTPSWLNDFKVEREHEADEETELAEPRRRGRPPKYLDFTEKNYRSLVDHAGHRTTEDSALRRGRGRPKNAVFINVKEPRFFVRKKNGEDLATSV